MEREGEGENDGGGEGRGESVPISYNAALLRKHKSTFGHIAMKSCAMGDEWAALAAEKTGKTEQLTEAPIIASTYLGHPPCHVLEAAGDVHVLYKYTKQVTVYGTYACPLTTTGSHKKSR